MSLTGRLTVFLVIAVVLGALVLTCAVWHRIPGPTWVRWPARVSLIVVCQLTAVSLAAVGLNDTDRFYNSWTELFGGHQSHLTMAHRERPGFQTQLNQQLLAQHHRAGTSAVISILVPDAGSANVQTALVYLPAAYLQPAYASRQFPVVELLDGYPGSPQTWTGPMHLQRHADAEIAAGRAAPFIAVMPVQNYLPKDGECLDVPGGSQVESTLVNSVRNSVLKDLRVSPDRRSWALMGYSTGGYCALNIALRHPQDYSSAVSILGNTSPYQDGETGAVFTKHPGLREQNDPMWLLAHAAQPDVSLLLATSSGDRATARQGKAFVRLVRAPLRAQLDPTAVGGHNFHTFELYEPIGLDWLSAQLSPPLAPAPTVRPPAQTPRRH